MKIKYLLSWDTGPHLQENEAIFSKNYLSNILERIFEKLRICTKIPAPLSLLTVE